MPNPRTLESVTIGKRTVNRPHYLPLPGIDDQKIFFSRTVVLESASAGTAINIVAKSEVPAGFKPNIQFFIATVNGGTAWGTTTTVWIRDTAATPTDFVTIAVAALTANARVVPGTANSTMNSAYAHGTGGVAGEGLVVVANANGTGSNLIVTVHGFYDRSF